MLNEAGPGNRDSHDPPPQRSRFDRFIGRLSLGGLIVGVVGFASLCTDGAYTTTMTSYENPVRVSDQINPRVTAWVKDRVPAEASITALGFAVAIGGVSAQALRRRLMDN